MYLLRRGKVIEWDNNGNPVRVVGTHTDITKLKETELKLKEYQEAYGDLDVAKTSKESVKATIQ